MTITNESDMSIQNHNGQANNLGVGVAMGASKQDVNPRDAYSVPGILHFIQHEWAKFELERSKWDVERAELEAKIAFLQGERKGQENLKNDLVRRIKMLEHALKQERARFHKLKYGAELSQGDLKDAELDEVQEDAGEADQLIIASSDISWRQGRQLLRQYLHEIGYTDTVIDVRSNRVRSLLGLKENKEGVPAPCSDTVTSKGDVQTKAVSQNQAGMLAEDMLREAEQAVLANCHFLNPEGGVPVDEGDEDEEDWKSEEINTGKQGKALGDDERDSSNMAMALKSLDFNFGNISMGSMVNPWDENSAMRLAASKDPSLQKPGMRINSAHYGMEVNEESLEEMGLGELAQLTVTNEAEGIYESGTSKEAYSKMWNAKYTLRSHFDGVRALAFHPIEPVLITASEDHTLKLWNLMRTIAGKKTAFLDVEPVYTFRGHEGAVLSTCMNPTGEQCYSGGQDGTVRVWNVPNSNIDPYDAYDPDVLSQTLAGHSDAVLGPDVPHAEAAAALLLGGRQRQAVEPRQQGAAAAVVRRRRAGHGPPQLGRLRPRGLQPHGGGVHQRPLGHLRPGDLQAGGAARVEPERGRRRDPRPGQLRGVAPDHAGDGGRPRGSPHPLLRQRDGQGGAGDGGAPGRRHQSGRRPQRPVPALGQPRLQRAALEPRQQTVRPGDHRAPQEERREHPLCRLPPDQAVHRVWRRRRARQGVCVGAGRECHPASPGQHPPPPPLTGPSGRRRAARRLAFSQC